MVAIATLIDICKQKWIAKTLLDREKNIKFQIFIICREIYSAIKVKLELLFLPPTSKQHGLKEPKFVCKTYKNSARRFSS